MKISKPILLTGISIICCLFCFVSAAFAQFSKLNPLTNPSTDEVRQTFQNYPDKNFATGPLWVWNDLLTETQIRSTLQDLASQKVMQAFVHPRPGLMTPYLSDDWFRLWRVALDEAEKLDMNIWIYDENSYPSGFAGGFVPKALPDSRAKALTFKQVDSLDKIDEDVMFIYRRNDDGNFENVTDEMKKTGEPLPTGKWLIASRVWCGSSSWYGGTYFVDLLKKGVTEKFIEITLEAYKRELGEYFGKRIPGCFTDEPNLGTVPGLNWSEDMEEYFQKEFGYSLIDSLPLMAIEGTMTTSDGRVIDYQEVHHNYEEIRNRLFIERWAIPYHHFCEDNGLEFTGHYWEHGWPTTKAVPDNMAMYIWHQRPAIDMLMNQWSDNFYVGQQFGNTRSVRELGSAANQMGHSRTLSETYGAGGWDIQFKDMKRIADWQYALGVNTTDEHLSYVTIRGARKHDHPQSFSYHAPWWNCYNVMEKYHTRVSYLVSQGKQDNDILVLQPTTSAWMYQDTPHVTEIGVSFNEFIKKLEANQIEYDLASEDILTRIGRVEDGMLWSGVADYSTVVIPEWNENLNFSTLKLFNEFLSTGKGKIFVLGEMPNRVDGKPVERLSEDKMAEYQKFVDRVKRPDDVPNNMADVAGLLRVSSDEFLSLVKDNGNISFLTVAGTPLVREKLFHHRRQIDNGEILFLCNIDEKDSAVGQIITRPIQDSTGQNDAVYWEKVEWLDLFSGEVTPCDTLTGVDGTKSCISFNLPPCGSLALLLTKGTRPAEATTVEINDTVLLPEAMPVVKRDEANILLIDYMDARIGDEVLTDRYFFQVDNRIWQKHGFENGNPWSRSVQFGDELIRHEFPDGDGFEVTYHFDIDDSYMNAEKQCPMRAVVEVPELYTITCNGKAVAPIEGEWWLDHSFGVLDISDAIQAGENAITLTASKMTMYNEIMPIYLLGDFSLRAQKRGFRIEAAKPLVFAFEEEPKENLPPGHSTDIEKVAWLSSGIGFDGAGIDFDGTQNDYAPWLVFKFDKKQKVCAARIWNYTERNMTRRGVKDLTVLAGDIQKESGQQIGRFQLMEGDPAGIASETYPELIVFDETVGETDVISFQIGSNHNGVSYPVSGTKESIKRTAAKDCGFVGLAEVEFLTKDEKGNLVPVQGVHVLPSSELTIHSFDRKAEHLLDRSGLIANVKPEPTWNNQGLPFYSDSVTYSETIKISEKQDNAKYLVKLPRIGSLEDENSGGRWNGVVARVFVNDSFAGYVFCEPDELDVTTFVKNGENKIDVAVIGSPKNMFGPHHIGKVRGSAWPASFSSAPEHCPQGRSYDIIPYGMLEPFLLIQRTRK